MKAQKTTYILIAVTNGPINSWTIKLEIENTDDSRQNNSREQPKSEHRLKFKKVKYKISKEQLLWNFSIIIQCQKIAEGVHLRLKNSILSELEISEKPYFSKKSKHLSKKSRLVQKNPKIDPQGSLNAFSKPKTSDIQGYSSMKFENLVKNAHDAEKTQRSRLFLQKSEKNVHPGIRTHTAKWSSGVVRLNL